MKLKTYLGILAAIAIGVGTSWGVPPSKAHHPIAKQLREKRQEQTHPTEALQTEETHKPTVALNLGEKKSSQAPRYHKRYKLGIVSK